VFGLDSATRFTAWQLKSEPKGFQSGIDSWNAPDFRSVKWKLGRPLIPVRCVRPKAEKLPAMPSLSENWPVRCLLSSSILSYLSFSSRQCTRKKTGHARVPVTGLFRRSPASRRPGIESSQTSALIPLLDRPERRPDAKLQPPAYHASIAWSIAPPPPGITTDNSVPPPGTATDSSVPEMACAAWFSGPFLFLLHISFLLSCLYRIGISFFTVSCHWFLAIFLCNWSVKLVFTM
jgi:hypothetical protein